MADPDIFLIAPRDLGPEAVARIADALDASAASALLLPRGGHDGAAYEAFVRRVLPLAQQRGAAVLIEGEPADVRAFGADGLHVSGALGAVRAAVAALRPDFIVGATAGGTRHDAMSRGELDLDYVFFGPLSGAIDEPTRALARWWAETMEVPAVFSDPEATIENHDAEGCEFIGIGEGFWEHAR
jgi:thiamine-phosphate pyrophosphorylase